MYSCNLCKKDDKEFRVPADEIGVALMQAHLLESHNIQS